MVELPDRTEQAEDAFVAAHMEQDDLDALIRAVTAAIQARRPRLAARLVGLLDGRVEIPEGSALARARAAARLLLHDRREEASWAALEAAWGEVRRRRRMTRARRRMREALRGEGAHILGPGRDTRRRR